MIFLEVDGQAFGGFTDISVVRAVRGLSGSFSFGATSSKKNQLPVRIGQKCRVLIDDNPIITGFIETVDINYDEGTHSIAIAGRDKTMDVIDSSTVIKELTGTITLDKAISEILKGNGITDIQVVNLIRTERLAPFREGDIESAEVGETMFEYMEKYARKRQVFLTGDGEGNIAIARAGTNSSDTALLHLLDSDSNNVKSASASYSETELFNKYVVRSQQNPVALEGAGDTPTEDLVDQSGEVIDDNVRATRIIELRPDQSGSNEDSKQFAIWSKNIRLARSFNYTAVVQGFYQDASQKRLWKANDLVNVKDDFVGIDSRLDAELLIDTIEYKFDLDSGSTTTMTMIDKDSYTLEAEKDLREARANDTGI